MTHHDGFASASAYRESVRLAGLRSRAVPGPRRASGDAENWRRGAIGERLVGRALEDLIVDGVRVVHDRRIPGSLANIDHIAIAATGVYVVDAKSHVGRPRVDILSATERRLYLGREDATDLVRGIQRQVRVVSQVVGESSVPVRGILCFSGADWDLVNGYLVDGVGVTSLDGLADLLRLPGPLSAAEIEGLHGRLGSSLDPA
ncbi:MAG: nuclease-related domain-containing protein [Pseudolysinimonas sp.]|uniref:nuclease-related domain-containing protein n=1 Tax=Pseudolysinimonas sp. TaxID=2680009 RepID=UPI0032663FA2